MEKNRELREISPCECKALAPNSKLELLNVLLSQVPTVFVPNVDCRLDRGYLRDIHHEAQTIAQQKPELRSEMERISSLTWQLSNGHIDRTTFIKNINDVHVAVEIAVRREQLLSSIAAKLSTKAIEQLEHLDALL